MNLKEENPLWGNYSDYVKLLKSSLQMATKIYDKMNDQDYFKSTTKKYIDDLKVQINYYSK